MTVNPQPKPAVIDRELINAAQAMIRQDDMSFMSTSGGIAGRHLANMILERATTTLKCIIEERNPTGQLEAEIEVERTVTNGRTVQETVRETRYDTDTGTPRFQRRAVNPTRAREYIARAEENGCLQ